MEKVGDFSDIIYEKAEGIARITINRPEVRNAFRPETVTQMFNAFVDAREDQEIGANSSNRQRTRCRWEIRILLGRRPEN